MKTFIIFSVFGLAFSQLPGQPRDDTCGNFMFVYGGKFFFQEIVKVGKTKSTNKNPPNKVMNNEFLK